MTKHGTKECVVATKGKTVVLVNTCYKCCLRLRVTSVAYTMHRVLKQSSVALGSQHIVVARNLIPARCSGLDISRWMISE